MRATGALFMLLAVACANRPDGGETGRTDGADASPAPTPDDAAPSASGGPDASSASSDGETPSAPSQAVADVLSVTVSGRPGDYSLAVELRSPDTGCDRYADWWEVIDAEGNLVYRRILAHSHVDEQPFTRSGGPVPADAETPLWVRAHMHGDDVAPNGYGGRVLTGTAQGGFAQTDAELAPLDQAPPLPDGCAF